MNQKFWDDTNRQDESVPHGVQVALCLSPLDRGIVSTTFAGGIMERLMDITDEMDKELEGIASSLDIVRRGGRVQLELLQRRRHVEDGIDDILTTVRELEQAVVWRVITRRVDKVLRSCPPVEKRKQGGRRGLF